MYSPFTTDMQREMRIPYVLRRVPTSRFASLLPLPTAPQPGDIALASLEKVGKNTSLELCDGRRCNLHEGNLMAVVLGHRYATQQFEGYARINGDHCDLLSIGGLVGTVESKHANVSEPSKLRLIGMLGDADGHPLRLAEFAVRPAPRARQPRVIVVCGTSMDSGKTHTVMSVVVGLRQQGERVAAIKLTGTAAGRDSWTMLDAGACVALNFVDGGFPSTYLCSLEELLTLHQLLLAEAVAHGASSVVIEIADGLLQRETAALLQNSGFRTGVDSWIFAAGDPLAALGGINVLRSWGIEPVAISGLVSMSPLCVQEAHAATSLPVLTAQELQAGQLNLRLLPARLDSALLPPVCIPPHDRVPTL